MHAYAGQCQKELIDKADNTSSSNGTDKASTRVVFCQGCCPIRDETLITGEVMNVMQIANQLQVEGARVCQSCFVSR